MTHEKQQQNLDKSIHRVRTELNMTLTNLLTNKSFFKLCKLTARSFC